MNQKSIILALLMFCSLQSYGQAYKIKVKINDYTNDTLLLGYHFGDKQYIKDTARKTGDGFEFTGDTMLEQGMYLIVTKPDHDYFQILIDDKQHFSIETNKSELATAIKFKGSKINQEFNEYLDYISANRAKADSLGQLIQYSKDSTIIKHYKAELDLVDQSVKTKQEKIIKGNDKSLLALLIKWSKDVEVPDFPGKSKEEKEQLGFDYYKSHYFSQLSFDDNRVVRLPLFHQKVDRYIQKLTVQIPDSLNNALDYILGKTDLKNEVFRYLLSTYLNYYANSQYVGMDAVYVHLVEKYYDSGLANWIDKEHLAKMSQDAKALKPLLIDKVAPNCKLYKQDGSPVVIHDIKSPYLILIFWAPDCGHCKTAMPGVVDFYNKYKEKGVEILSVCTKLGDEEKTCWEGIKTLKLEPLMTVTDQYHQSRYKVLYDLKSTPQVYILDSDKKILTKKIAVEKLGEVMDKLLNIKANEQN